MKKLILLLLISGSAMAQQSAKKNKYSINEFMLIEKVEDQEKKYNEVLKEPVENLAPTAINDLRAELAYSWLAKGNVERYRFYKATNPKFSARQSLNLSYALEKLFDERKKYAEVAEISKELMNVSFDDFLDINSVFSDLNAAANAKLGNVDIAKKMIEKSTRRDIAPATDAGYFKDVKSNYLNRYAIVMSAAGEYKTAFDTLSKAFRDADSNPYMVETFRDVYTKVKGNGKDFDQYLRSLRDEAYQKYYHKVERMYVDSPKLTLNGTIPDPEGGPKPITSFSANKPVQDVTMKNLEGKDVKLGDYKGKILVIDFWTTGCTPCVAAFAGFEKVVADYKKNELQLFVVNLFEENATVKAFAAQKPIKLDVLQDQENMGYNVQATPTKIIFDPMGNIRFFSTGYAGSTDREYYKLKAMVEITKARTGGVVMK